jgi:hypothetical protein
LAQVRSVDSDFGTIAYPVCVAASSGGEACSASKVQKQTRFHFQMGRKRWRPLLKGANVSRGAADASVGQTL